MAANKVTRLVYKRQDGKWAWNLSVGSDIVATDGSQGYENEADATERADAVVNGLYAAAERTRRPRKSSGKPAPVRT